MVRVLDPDRRCYRMVLARLQPHTFNRPTCAVFISKILSACKMTKAPAIRSHAPHLIVITSEARGLGSACATIIAGNGQTPRFPPSLVMTMRSWNREERHLTRLTWFGLFAVTAMLVCYAFENRSRWFTLAFAVACLLGSAYGFLQGAWPFGIVEAIWSVVAVRRWWLAN